MSEESSQPFDSGTTGDSTGAGEQPGGGKRRDPLEEIASKIDAALAELRPKLRSAISELDQRVDSAIGDVKSKARPKVDELVSELQPRLDSLISRVQTALDGLKKDLEGRADRAEARQGAAESAAAGHWPEMKEDTHPADPPMEKGYGASPAAEAPAADPAPAADAAPAAGTDEDETPPV